MRFSLLLAALPLLFFVGCSEEALQFSSCATSAECATGFTCTNSFCVASEGRGGPTGRDTETNGEVDGDTGNTGLDVGRTDTNTGGDVATLDVPVSQDTGECVPNCAGLACGEDGCGGSCGVCSGTESCVSGQCEESESGGMTCPDVIGCINESDQSESAIQACIGQGTPPAQSQINDLVGCIQVNCSEPGMTDEEFGDCQQASCGAEISACTGVGTGGGTCNSVIECLLGCSDTPCGDACIEMGTREAQNAAIGLYNCVIDACPDGTVDQFYECADSNCGSESTECSAN